MINERKIRQAPRKATTVILAGGRGSRLKRLTDWQAKPAVPFGGKFRIIDFALSNCVNSGFRRISVLTQYKSHSLFHHLQRGWGFLCPEMNEFIDLIPAQQRINETDWYQGTADAVYQNLDILETHKAEWILILAGDHVYKMDYSEMLSDHIRNKADVTVACVEVPRLEASGFGVMGVDDRRKVISFFEKPKIPAAIPGQPHMALASMGIYIFNTKFLFDQLRRDAADLNSLHDFGRDVIPYLVKNNAHVHAHYFSESCVDHSDKGAYWRDVGTVDSYWKANVDMTLADSLLDLYSEHWPIFTYQEHLPPARFCYPEGINGSEVINCIVSGGCIVEGAVTRSSLLFNRVNVDARCIIDKAVILPSSNIGKNCRLQNVIIDSECHVPDGFIIGEDPEMDARRFYRTEKGIVLVTKDMLEAIN